MLSFLQANLAWIVYWTVTIMALVGVVLNIEQDTRCFFIWGFTNAAFAVRTYFLGAYEMTVLFTIYFVLAIVGIIRWNQKANSVEEVI